MRIQVALPSFGDSSVFPPNAARPAPRCGPGLRLTRGRMKVASERAIRELRGCLAAPARALVKRSLCDRQRPLRSQETQHLWLFRNVFNHSSRDTFHPKSEHSLLGTQAHESRPPCTHVPAKRGDVGRSVHRRAPTCRAQCQGPGMRSPWGSQNPQAAHDGPSLQIPI